MRTNAVLSLLTIGVFASLFLPKLIFAQDDFLEDLQGESTSNLTARSPFNAGGIKCHGVLGHPCQMNCVKDKANQGEPKVCNGGDRHCMCTAGRSAWHLHAYQCMRGCCSLIRKDATKKTVQDITQLCNQWMQPANPPPPPPPPPPPETIKHSPCIAACKAASIQTYQPLNFCKPTDYDCMCYPQLGPFQANMVNCEAACPGINREDAVADANAFVDGWCENNSMAFLSNEDL